MNSENQNKKTGKKGLVLKVINIIVVVGFGIFLVWYLLSKIDIEDLKSAFTEINKPMLIIGLLVMFSSNYFRAYRKNTLIGSDRVNMIDMFLVAQIRNAFNMVLPARTGELSYVYVLTTKFGFPLEIGVSTLMVALVFDLVIVFSLIIISIIIVGINTYSISSVSVIIIAAALLVVSLLILFYLPKIISFFLFIFKKILSRFRISEKGTLYKIYSKLTDIKENIKIIRERGIYLKVYFTSIAIRVLKFSSYYLIIYAIMQPMGYTFDNLNFWVILLATSAAEISAVLPTHALAGYGTYESAFVLAMVILGFDREISIISGFGFHTIILLFTVALGIISMIIISLPFYKIKK
jgi:glycosyltransferase 2 family protein